MFEWGHVRHVYTCGSERNQKIRHKLLNIFGDIGHFMASKTLFVAILMCV